MRLRRSPGVPEVELPPGSTVVAVCHPAWRGIRTAVRSSQLPVFESPDLSIASATVVRQLLDQGIEQVLVHGYPPGTDRFVQEAHKAGLWTACILHSSPAQHIGDGIEGQVVDRVLALNRQGTLDKVGFVKAGVAEAFARLGYRTGHLPNRAPAAPSAERLDLGTGFHVGVFVEPLFRKNMATQILAAAMFDDVVVHVIRAPDLAYAEAVPIVEHGDLPWDRFQALVGSVDINLYVSLSECHPMTPIESYLAGVPCLISRTSDLFVESSWLSQMTVTPAHDNPKAVADSARALLTVTDRAVDEAQAWIRTADLRAAKALESFLHRSEPVEGD